ncbi:MAG: cyclic nucleotide-binding domain-containing protein [Desulfobacterium sp.]|nr:cyclic nucleotide-binding domain-containing protein [Desulfobacterium sp.]
MIESKDLKCVSVFKDLSNDELDRIKIYVSEETFKKGTTLFKEGMRGGVMYIVKSGEIEIFQKARPSEISLAKLKAGSFVGEMSMIDDEPRSASARISANAVLLIITKASFREIITKNAESGNKILLSFLKMLSTRLRDTNKKVLTTV